MRSGGSCARNAIDDEITPAPRTPRVLRMRTRFSPHSGARLDSPWPVRPTHHRTNLLSPNSLADEIFAPRPVIGTAPRKRKPGASRGRKADGTRATASWPGYRMELSSCQPEAPTDARVLPCGHRRRVRSAHDPVTRDSSSLKRSRSAPSSSSWPRSSAPSLPRRAHSAHRRPHRRSRCLRAPALPAAP